MNQPKPDFHIARPCPASWEGMSGDERKRFCAACKLHVHNLSEMEKRDAEKLLQEHAGRLCVTYQCDSQKRPLFRSDLQALAAAAASAALLVSACAPPGRSTGEPRPGTSQPAQAVPAPGEVEPCKLGEVAPPAPPPVKLMGKIAAP
ncbi:MAG: hypothetical protein RL095_2972 [Verrucomicrobiota bacterium]|jgi:hypothetical protein